MKFLKYLILLLPLAANADIQIDGMGAVKDWYFQADFERMRSTEAGKPLYAWMKGEVFKEVREESGIDLDKVLNQVIAQSDGDDGVILLVNGNIRQEHKDQVMALAATQNVELAPRKAGRREYFYVEGDGSRKDDEPFSDGAYFSFAIDDKLLLTSSEEQMKALLDNGARLKPRDSGAMIMFSAEQAFVEAGIETTADASEQWDSNIMKNTEQAAVLVADAGGKIGVEARLVSKEAQMAESLASIVRGLISLQAFNDEMDPEIAGLLKATKVDVRDRTLSVSIALDPDVVVSILNQ